ncbi:FkbM family methyltransferase [Solirubrobacter sp. CPCC 204708]|uniref:FkbM family methyltransferase n=1 Tax=Solirubrobacter deserti TaxID=2282478 RepID=A0ABT4RMB6_9ACTN|nr:FkbM family methyltransferase [Solirubrobacter deserti]MBE2317973.1 FkbM family methyltransferase [Solirubrobacter deserti]MDA0139652.1 FkbM family methyltransferase [Solirubrobacter deserti]
MTEGLGVLEAARTRARARAERLVRGWLRRRGLAIVAHSPDEYVHARRARVLAEHGVDVVLDVGANTGQYVGHLRQEGFRGRVVSLEPVRATFERLRQAAASDSRWDVRHAAAGEAAGTLELHVYADSVHNSARAPSPGRPMPARIGSETAPVITLDSLSGDVWSAGDAIALKIDVEGFEGEVLRGASSLLEHVRVVEVELSTVPLHEGQWLLPDVASYLYARGFALTSLRPIWTDPGTGALVLADGIFERRDASRAPG